MMLAAATVVTASYRLVIYNQLVILFSSFHQVVLALKVKSSNSGNYLVGEAPGQLQCEDDYVSTVYEEDVLKTHSRQKGVSDDSSQAAATANIETVVLDFSSDNSVFMGLDNFNLKFV